MDAADYVISPLIEPRVEEGSKDRTMVLNMGPQHPSTHGVLRLVLEIDGETVLRLVPDIGFLHTGIEKTCEAKFYQQVVPLTDRIDYLSPMSNNLCYCLAVEKLLQLEIPPRAQFLRVLLNELTRLQSHLVWLGTHAMDIGALTLFLYTFREREEILKIFEDVSGQRMMGSYFRVGGIALEPPVDFYERVQTLLKMMPEKIDEYENLLNGNPIWVSRLQGVGYLSAADAIALGVTGPPLRASGVDWDLAPRYAIFRLRKISVQGARLQRRRCLDPIHGAGAGDAGVGQNLPAGVGRNADRAHQGRLAQGGVAGPGKDEDPDGISHLSLQDCDRRICRARRPGLPGN